MRGAGESVLSKIPSSLSGKALSAIDVRVRKCFSDDLEAENDNVGVKVREIQVGATYSH